MQRFLDNPFYVLSLKPNATRSDVEREGQKLLSMLELGLQQARDYVTPLGPRQRTSELIRWAMSELRDPDKRLQHELWAQLDAETPLPQPQPPQNPEPAQSGFPSALRALGWER